jgi:hypothetical protein
MLAPETPKEYEAEKKSKPKEEEKKAYEKTNAEWHPFLKIDHSLRPQSWHHKLTKH